VFEKAIAKRGGWEYQIENVGVMPTLRRAVGHADYASICKRLEKVFVPSKHLPSI
jgi:hypothetical protein